VARSYTTRAFVDDKGLPLINAWCRAFNASTSALIETQYTGSTGTATFTTLPEDVNVNICCVWGTKVVWLYNIFSATQDLLYLSVTEAIISNLAVTAAKIANATITNAQIANATITNAQIANATILDANISTCSIGKLTAGNLAVTFTITTGSLSASSGTVTIDSNGLTIKGQKAIFRDASGNVKGYLLGIFAGAFNLLANPGVALVLTSTSRIVISSAETETQFLAGGLNATYASHLDLPIRSSDPTATEGRMYYCTSGTANGYIRYYDANAGAWKNIARV